MSKLSLISIITAAIFLLGGNLLAGDSKDKDRIQLPKGLKYQETCPVTGGKINKDYYLDIQGHRIYFSCEACIDSMRADPERYFKKAGEEGVVFENILETCPISGEEIDKSVFIYYQGRLLYLCSKEARKLFMEDRPSYFKVLDEHMKSEASKKAQK
ncbi:MAG TPA: hypothetical protein ENO22_01860 [candidate division Zixibacteria bacterium]|nr:hypothetical protein [candidate division Zixibacteria bacterium]